MSSIGGYFGMEFGSGSPPHPQAMALNLGRHALALVVRSRGYRRLHVPRYTCDVLGGPLRSSGVELVFYGSDDSMDPLFDPQGVDEGEGFLYTNYFGLKDRTVARIAAVGRNLIVDNAQSFYAPPLPGVDTFYSCRKFFGTPDGAYLYSSACSIIDLERDRSYDRLEHLLRAVDQGTEEGYPYFLAHEEALDRIPMRAMSHLTTAMMAGIDHAEVRAKRRRNRDQLHRELKDRNLLPIDPAGAEVPMVYPFLTEDRTLRERLLAHRIYSPRYWPGLLGPVEAGTAEQRLVDSIVHLPIDQRYGTEHMDRVLEVVMK
ncbi:MAG: hypothetical protein IPK70_06800 [Flavobacteriales bacterium]|nr:hypothetical protein [Flavobacteriales bacterium]MBK9174804.1 hypothetical protein [Flavobacteriales bacterium]